MTSRISYLLLLAATVLLTTLILSVEGNFREYVGDFREEQRIEVYLRSPATAQQLETLVTTIKALPGYQAFALEDSEKAFAQMQSLLGEALLPDASRNPFPDRIMVAFSADYARIDHFRNVAPILQNSAIVDTVTYNAEWLAAQEDAFTRWDYIISGTLGLSILAGLAALILCVAYAEEHYRGLLRALQTHGAGLGKILRRFVGRWAGLAVLATTLGMGVAYLIWYLIRERFASELFVDPVLLACVFLGIIGLATVSLLIKALRYR